MGAYGAHKYFPGKATKEECYPKGPSWQRFNIFMVLILPLGPHKRNYREIVKDFFVVMLLSHLGYVRMIDGFKKLFN